MAKSIMRDALYLSHGFDELDIALKLDQGKGDSQSGMISAQWLMTRMREKLQPIISEQQISLEYKNSDSDLAIAIGKGEVDRLIITFLSAVISHAAKGETLAIKIAPKGARKIFAAIAISKPVALNLIDNEQLLNPDFDMTDSRHRHSLVGIGFTLRVIKQLAMKNGGYLQFHDNDVVLHLPLARVADTHAHEPQR